ncbi:DUF3592 domain-containing protein [Agromyces sp. CFH 90414]|uniref:DUF3592 domain-containing protein n=1 Tax=Agromyces agglutinans TaxID=2662258 RepID=A0A6I2FET3_9MICO|nr:DUF3592 domain-containing protein [Agromyces agglutinans]MRG60403.1 DUF3592 domain-containing protein [Agromyces agglutinans]
MPGTRWKPPKPVGRGQVAAWIVAMSITALIALLTVVGGLGIAFGHTEHTGATIVGERIDSQPRSTDTCVLTLEYTSAGVAYTVDAGVAWFSCPERYVVGEVVDVRLDPTRPDTPLIAGAEGHVFVRDTAMAVVLGIVPGLAVWAFGLAALRRRRAERVAAAPAAATTIRAP